MGSLLKQLNHFYKDEPNELKRILIDYAEDWGYPIIDSTGRLRLDNLKKNLDNKYPSDENLNKKIKNNATTYNYWKLVITFHFLYRVPLKAFNIGNKKSFLVKKLKENSHSESEVIRLKALDQNKNDRAHKEEAYLIPLLSLISKMEKSLFIYDYLERQDFTTLENNYATSYNHLNKQLYRKIEEELFENDSTKKKEYIRILVLPIRSKYSHIEEPTSEDLIKYILRYCSPNLFDHLCACSSKKIKNKKIKTTFYMAGNPTRLYEYAVLDGGDHSMTELYRYSSTQVSRPDLLIIEDNKGKYNEIANLYKEEIEALQKKGTNILNINKCKPILLKIINDFKLELKNLKIEFKKLKNDYEEDSKKLDETIIDKYESKIDELKSKINNTDKKLTSLSNYF